MIIKIAEIEKIDFENKETKIFFQNFNSFNIVKSKNYLNRLKKF